eukprot:18384-Eustigmatos_ZCMA.PRE.1
MVARGRYTGAACRVRRRGFLAGQQQQLRGGAAAQHPPKPDVHRGHPRALAHTPHTAPGGTGPGGEGRPPPQVCPRVEWHAWACTGKD